MALDRLLNVARKEFADQITSRRFIIILALFLAISAIGIHIGIENYNTLLDSYNQQLQYMQDSEAPYASWMPEKPSIMLVFSAMMSYMVSLGSVLAIATGFDLVSREKETRSLKTLLSHPVYRDEIINGKALGGIAALGFAMVLALAISFAMLLIFSIVPTVEESLAILVFGAVSLLFLLGYFAVALTMSTVAPESGSALIYTLVIFVLVSSLIPILGMAIGNVFVGDPPQPPQSTPMVVRSDGGGGYFTSTSSQSVVHVGADDPAWQQYEEDRKRYVERQALVYDISYILSPQMNYAVVSMAVTNPRIAAAISSPYTYDYTQASTAETPGLADALAQVWKNLAALIVFPSVFFAAAYVKFMRMDIR